MKKNIYLVLACLLFLVGCDKTSDPVTIIKNEIKVKVYNTSSWDSATNKMDTVVGATVSLITDKANITAVTDSNGIATFDDVKEQRYCLDVTKGNLKNLINLYFIQNQLVGNIITGVYTSQADIESSATNSSAIIGGPKLMDVNGDGRINDDDKVLGYYLNFEYKYQDVNEDGILDVKDIVNGNLIKVDNLVKETVFVGI